MAAITVVAQAGLQTRAITLGPRETQVLQLRDFIVSGQDKSPATLLTLESSGAPGSLVATGFAYNESNGFSTNLLFVDRSTIKTRMLAGAHFKFGLVNFNSELPQRATFRAPLALANPTDTPVLANIAVDYTLNGIVNRVDLGRIKIGAKQIKQFDLSQELADRGLTGLVDDAGIQITYNGQPGSLLARLTSLDKTGDFVFDTPIKDPLAESFRVSGNYPWRLDRGYNTVVHLKNITNKEVYAVAQIRYEGGSYNPDKIRLAPYQTVALDIRKLRDEQIEDIRGKMMPVDITSGQIIWYEQTQESLIGRAEAFDVADGIASSFSCGGPGNCGMSFSSASASPSTKNATAEDSGAFFTAQETDRDCLNSSFGPFAITSGLTWTSTDPGVATVDPSSGFVRCVSAGTATIKATWSTGVNNCGMSCQFIPVNPVAAGTLQIKPHLEAMDPPRGVQGFGDLNINITGKGFGNNKNAISLTVAGTGITPVVNSATPNEILATFTIAADATGGNHTVTLKVNNRNADRTLNFFVQIPTKLRRDSISDVINEQGGCGAHRDVQYTLMDQQTPTAQPINTDAKITETFSNFTANNPGIRPPRVTDTDIVAGLVSDFVGYEIPTCPPAFTASMDQTFVVTIGNKDYPLTTKNRIIWSMNAAGTRSISVTITTP